MFLSVNKSKKISKEYLENLINKFHGESENNRVDSPIRVVNFYKDNHCDGETLRVIYSNVQFNPVSYRDFKIQDKQITDDLFDLILRDSTLMMTPSLCMVINRTLNDVELGTLESIAEKLSEINFSVDDIVGINHENFYSYTGNSSEFSSKMQDYYYRDFEKIDSTLHHLEYTNLYSYIAKELGNEYTINEIREIVSDEVISNKIKDNYSFLSNEDIKKITKTIYDQELNQREELGLIALKQGKIIEMDSIFKGGISSASVDTRVIMNKLLSCESDGFIIYHNHPSGIPNQSFADKRLSERLNKVSKLYNITYVDHFIIGKGVVKTNVGEQENIIQYKNKFKPKRFVKRKLKDLDYER